MSIIYGTLERLETQSVGGQASLARAPRNDRAGRFLAAMFVCLSVLVLVSAYAGWRYLQTAVGHVQVPAVAFVDAGADAGETELAADGNVEPESTENQPSAEHGDSLLAAGAQLVEPDERVKPVEAEAPEAVEVPVVPSKPADTSGGEGFAQVAEAPPASGQASADAVPAVEVAQTGNTSPVVLPPQPDRIDVAVDEARNALSRGNYSHALAVLESVPEVSERRADYWLVKGSAHLALGMLEAAESSLVKAGSVAPDNPQVAVQLAIVKQEQNDHPAALRILAEAATKNAHVPEIFLNMGYSQIAVGAQPDAQRSFRTFMKLTRDRSRYQQQREALERWLQQASVATR